MDHQDFLQLVVDVLYHSGILSVVGSALSGMLAPALDRTLGDTTRWCLIVVLCFARGSTPPLPLMGRYINLHAYIVAWHLELFIRPIVDRFVFMGTDDDFLNRLAVLEWKLRAFFLPWFAGHSLSLLWAYRFTTATAAALVLGAWVSFSRRTSSARPTRVWNGILMLTVSACRFWMTSDFSVRNALLRLHGHITIPLSRWEKDVARSRRRAAEATQQPGAFVYRPLESPRHIRLLKLQRKSWFNPPSCKLVHVCLDDIHQGRADTPVYEAISYTWGVKPPSIPLSVDGKRLLVTAAVDDFLFHRQSSFTPVYLWIDSICINQSSTAEKDVQLPLMREIYQSAQRTVVWLDTGGPTNAHEASALRRLIRRAGMYIRILELFNEGHKARRSMLYMSEKEKGAYRALGHLLSHPWFSRIWIIQEVAVSKKIHVMACGMCLDWFTLGTFVDCAHSIGELTRRLEQYTSPQASGHGDASGLEVSGAESAMFYQALSNAKFMFMVRHQLLTGDPLPLATLMLQSCTFFASTDPRDKVFALLGIASDGQALPFKPEYGRPVADIFIDTHSYILSSTGDRWSIALALAGRSYKSIFPGEPATGSPLSTALPSWVFDYSLSCIVGMRPPHPNVTARIDPSRTVTVLNDRHRYPRPTLLLPAIPLATVARLTAPFPLLRHQIRTINQDATDIEAEISTFPSNANCGAREWYTAALALVIPACSSDLEEEETTRQTLWELIIDLHLANETASAEVLPLFTNIGRSSSSRHSSHGNAQAPPQQPPLYPFHSTQARRLFEQYLLSPLEDDVRLTGWTATGDEGVSKAAHSHYMTLLIETFLFTVGGRRLAVLRGGEDGRHPLMALVPPGTQDGDLLMLVRGAWSPFLFRPVGQDSSFRDRVAELAGVCTLGGDEDGVLRDAAGWDDSKWEEWLLV